MIDLWFEFFEMQYQQFLCVAFMTLAFWPALMSGFKPEGVEDDEE